MEMTAAEYDACYALIGRPPGSPLADIEAAQRRFALLYHPDRFREPALKKKNEELVKPIFSACDRLSRYWREFKSAPPSDELAPKQAQQEEEERSQVEERERLREEQERCKREQDLKQREEIRVANLSIVIPPVPKRLSHDFIEWLEIKDAVWAVYTGIFVGAVIVTGLVVQMLNPIFEAQGLQESDLFGWIKFTVMASQVYLLGRGFHALSALYRLDRDRCERKVSRTLDEILKTVTEILGRHKAGAAAWSVGKPYQDASDGTTVVEGAVEFTKKYFGGLEIRYKITLSIRVKTALPAKSCRMGYWFTAEASRPWWPPAYAAITGLDNDLKRSLGIQ